MVKITFIGAGSAWFGKNLTTDILTFEGLKDSTLTLMDINEQKLKLIESYARKIVEQEKLPTKIEATTDRRKALESADFVIITIDTPFKAFEYDMLIPYKYGVDQCVGCTINPRGVFAAARLTPIVLDICRDMEKLCPNAILLNYTNPVSIICWAVYKSTPIKIVGLCNGPIGGARITAEYLGIPLEEVTYWAAGINHLGWFLEFKWKGKDAYPLIWKKIREDSPSKNKTGLDFEVKYDKIRYEMLKATGYLPILSSGHISEHIPYYRRRKDLVKKFCSGTGYAETLHYYRWVKKFHKSTERDLKEAIKSKKPIELKHSTEYAAGIINAIVTNKPYLFYGNVKNNGLITNLPQECCVEVPCYADGIGIHPCYIGDLPPVCAALARTNINVHELTVEAILTRNRELIYHAVMLDPLTSAVLTPGEIRKMVDEMFEAEAEWLTYFIK